MGELTEYERLISIRIMQEDAESIYSLLQTERDPIFAMEIIPYYALFVQSCQEYMGENLLPETMVKDLKDIRNHIKACAIMYVGDKSGEGNKLQGDMLHMPEDKIVIFETEDKSITLPVSVRNDTVWLSANQMAELFERDEKTIRKHINNVFSEGEVVRENNTQKLRVDGVKQQVPFYTLDVIISVGYRVKSRRGVEFRRWANSVLKEYIIKGYSVNYNRMNQLNEVIRIMKRVSEKLDTKQVLSVVERYSQALELLDAYDHQNMKRPKGNKAIYVLTYEECREIIDSMKYMDKSSLFGNEKSANKKSSRDL